MNSSAGPGDHVGGSQRMSGFGYGVGVSVGILLLITTITLASYFCTRPPQDPNHHRPANPTAGGNATDVEAGLDEATLATYPKLLHSQAKLRREGGGTEELPTAASCCSICLADYKDSDVLRVLPDCKHLFHAACVDPWLMLHPTCPVCRTSPAPSPATTPQMEVAPLAVRPLRS